MLSRLSFSPGLPVLTATISGASAGSSSSSGSSSAAAAAAAAHLQLISGGPSNLSQHSSQGSGPQASSPQTPTYVNL